MILFLKMPMEIGWLVINHEHPDTNDTYRLYNAAWERGKTLAVGEEISFCYRDQYYQLHRHE